MGNRESAEVQYVEPLTYRFEEWNAEIRYAREAYEVLLDEQESPDRHDMDPPAICRQKLHGLRTMTDVVRSAGGKWWCVRCREASRRRANGTGRGYARKLTPELDAEIRERYEAGDSAQLIAPDFGVAPVTVLKAVRRAGGQVRSLREAIETRLTRAA